MSTIIKQSSFFPPIFLNKENLALLFYVPNFSFQKEEREFSEVWDIVPGVGRMEGTMRRLYLCRKRLPDVMTSLELSSKHRAAGLHGHAEDWFGRITNHLSFIFTLCGSRVPAPRTSVKYNHPNIHPPHLLSSGCMEYNVTFILLMFSTLFQTLIKFTISQLLSITLHLIYI